MARPWILLATAAAAVAATRTTPGGIAGKLAGAMAKSPKFKSGVRAGRRQGAGWAGHRVGAANASATLVWNQNLAASVYTSASVSRHRGGSVNAPPTFAAATWLNQPVEVEVFNVSDSGDNIWSFVSPSMQATFQVDMSHHSYANAAGTVDTAVAFSDFSLPSSCAAYGFVSYGASASAVPVWNYTIPECDVGLLYDQYLMIDMSDDGSTVAFAVYANETISGNTVLTARAYVFAAQTGKLLMKYDLGADVQPSAGGVWLSETGAYLAYTNGNIVYVLETATGTLRANITTPFVMTATISYDGTYVATAQESAGLIYKWTGSGYTLAHSVQPPSTEPWFPEDIAVSSYTSGSTTSNYVTFGWVDGTVLQARITIFSMDTGTLLTDILTPTNTQLQTVPTVRMDQNFAAAAMWGDNDDVPTVYLIKVGASSPAFTYVTPGSMFGVDLVVDSVNATATTVYVAAAGKHVPANVMGNGGDAYAWQVVVPN